MRAATGFGALAIVGCLVSSCAFAQDTASLRIGDYMIANHYLVETGLKPWMEEIATATKGAVKFQHFPAQQLGKAGDLFRLTQSNVAQVSSLTLAMAGDKLELSGAAELPGLFATSCQGTKAYMQAAKSGPIAERDYAANGVHLLYPIIFRSFQLFSISRPITSVADVKGLKTMIPMRPTEMMFAQAGAVAMKLLSGPDTYQAVQKGIVDAFVFNPDSIFIYDLQGLTKYATQNGSFGQLASVYVMNLETWNKFDAATKAIIDAASAKAALRACQAIDDGFVKVFERMRESKMTITDLSPAALKDFQADADQAAAAWSKDLESRGKPGPDVLNLIRKSAKDNQ